MTRLVVTVAILAVSAAVIAAGSLAGASTRVNVLGFQEEGTPTSAIERSAAALSAVGVDGIDLINGGAGVSAPDGPRRSCTSPASPSGPWACPTRSKSRPRSALD